MHGKFIILSFSDGEDAIFANTVTALASVADFSTVAASADAPLLFGSLQIDPQRRLVWRRWSLIFCSCWPAGQGRCSPPARSMKLLRRTPLTPAGQGSPAWSTSSGANWALVSSKPFEATATVSRQNNRTAPSRFCRGGVAVPSFPFFV